MWTALSRRSPMLAKFGHCFVMFAALVRVWSKSGQLSAPGATARHLLHSFRKTPERAGSPESTFPGCVARNCLRETFVLML